jgi:hypothetical protein
VEFENITPGDILQFHKGCLDSCTLNVSYNGYTTSYRLSKEDRYAMQWERREFAPEYQTESAELTNRYNYSRTAADLVPAKWGKNAEWEGGFYLMYGLNVPTRSNEKTVNLWSPAFHVGYRLIHSFTKSYKIGLGVEYALGNYNYPTDKNNRLDQLYAIDQNGIGKKQFRHNEFAFELFQRVRITPTGGLVANGIHWDLGLYGSLGWDKYGVRYDTYNYASRAQIDIRGPHNLDNNLFNWGFTTRLTYDWIGIYARYRMTGLILGDEKIDDLLPTSFHLNLPRLEVGLQITL